MKKYIREATRFEVVLDIELRMKVILDEVIAYLDSNTQAYLLNVQQGQLPILNEWIFGGDDNESMYRSDE